MKLFRLLYINLIVFLTVACQFSQLNYLDLSKRVKSISITPSEEGSYFSPVWLSNTNITFLVFPRGNNDFMNPPKIPDLRSYDIVDKKWNKIPLKSDLNCRRIIYNFLRRLPDRQLGFVERCLPSNANDDVRTIREIDIATGESKILIEPSFDIRLTGPFSYSNDMSEILQEDMANHILSNKLFYRKGDTLIQIAPNFIRAMHPGWSPHKRQIAFWGTESYPGKNPQDFKTSSDISYLALYPWDLYVSSPEGDNIKKLLSSVDGALAIKWSPAKNIIAFSGTVEGVPGIWLIDPETSKLTRIWGIMGDSDFFDWSPDGRKIVVVNSDLDEKFKVIKQTISIISLDNQ